MIARILHSKDAEKWEEAKILLPMDDEKLEDVMRHYRFSRVVECESEYITNPREFDNIFQLNDELNRIAHYSYAEREILKLLVEKCGSYVDAREHLENHAYYFIDGKIRLLAL